MYAEHEGLEGLGWPSLGSPHRKDEEKDGQECPSYIKRRATIEFVARFLLYTFGAT